jgi:hypothetical protein
MSCNLISSHSAIRLRAAGEASYGVISNTCSFCNEPVEIKTGKTDDNGKAIHEECYAARMRLKAITPRPKPRDALSGQFS